MFERKFCFASHPKCLKKSLASHPKCLNKSCSLHPKCLSKCFCFAPKMFEQKSCFTPKMFVTKALLCTASVWTKVLLRIMMVEQKSCLALHPQCLNTSLAPHPKWLNKSLPLHSKCLNKSLFFLPAYGRCCPSVISRAAGHGQIEYPYYIKNRFSRCQYEGRYLSYQLMIPYDADKEFSKMQKYTHMHVQTVRSTVTERESGYSETFLASGTHATPYYFTLRYPRGSDIAQQGIAR